jgi:glucuronokinase
LAGNPSDGYGGAVLAVTLPSLTARVTADSARGLRVEPHSALVEAAARRLGVNAAITWNTTIPRSVGLGGSSAIVIATLRALCEIGGLSFAPSELAELALAIEVEDLGIAAGPQDRFAQAYGGATFMEFGGQRPECQQLDVSVLPPLVVAWRDAAPADSGPVHDGLRARFAAGERDVAESLRRLADAAREARRALQGGDFGRFARAVDASFDLRRELMALDPRHVEMIVTARAGGAAANYTGSGGAIVAVCLDAEHRAAIERALRAIGCSTVGVSVEKPARAR